MAEKNKDLTKMTYEELLSYAGEEQELGEIATKADEDSIKVDGVIKNTDPVAVVVKDGCVSDEDAKLPYENKNQTIYAHALVHMWYKYSEKTKWTRMQVAREHTRIVAKLINNGWGHIIKSSLDDTLPMNLCEDYAPSTGDEIVKPINIVIVTNKKEETVKESKTMSQAPMVDTSELHEEPIIEIGSMKVILNQSEFNPSVQEGNLQEYKKSLDSNKIDEIIEENEDALFLRVNAMHEGIWNFTALSKDELEKAAHTFVGRLVIEGHKWDDPDKSLGEVLKSVVRFDPEHQRYYLELIVTVTKPKAIKEVKAGRYKFVSIGATMKARCNICGLTVNEGCHHIRGMEYDTEEHGRVICIKTATEIMFEELSFINVPAARWARVLEKIDKNQVRELLAASKSGHTIGIHLQSEDVRILPTIDELLSLQEESIIKLYKKRDKEVVGMADKKTKKVEPNKEQFATVPGSDAPVSAPSSGTSQNTTKKPTQTSPPAKKSDSKGNVSDVSAPAKPIDGGSVDTGKNSGKIDTPTANKSDSKGNKSDVDATKHPKDGGTVDTGAGDGRSDVKGPATNPVVNSDEVTVDDNEVTITLTNEQIDGMDIGGIYEYVKNNEMIGLLEVLLAANSKGECETPIINVASADEAILTHALLHRWIDDMALTNWNEDQVSAEHDRIVNVLEEFGIGHEDSENVDTSTDSSDATNETVNQENAEDGTKTDAVNNDNVETEVNTEVKTEVTEDEGVDANNDKTVDEEANAETTEVVNDDSAIDADKELLSAQLEKSTKENGLLQEKFDSMTIEFTNVKETLSKEIFDLKLELAKSIRDGQKLTTELENANSLLASKTEEITALTTELEGYVSKELGSVANDIIQIKTDLNKYADDAAIEADREKYSKMPLDTLKTILSEIIEMKGNSLKNKAAEDHGIGDGGATLEESVNNEGVSGDDEIEKYQNKEIPENKEENKKDEFEVKENSVLSLVKSSLFTG